MRGKGASNYISLANISFRAIFISYWGERKGDFWRYCVLDDVLGHCRVKGERGGKLNENGKDRRTNCILFIIMRE